MTRTSNHEAACAGHDAQNAQSAQDAFALSCFRAIGASAPENPLGTVRDWRAAVHTLEVHGLLPFIGIAGARAPAASPVPDDVRQLALRSKLRLALYHANALDALADISRELNAAGIPYAVLKGPYLYELLYRDLFPRVCGDIDLLVPADRIRDAMEALEKAGYGDGAGPAHRTPMPRWHFHATLASGKPGGLPLELHRTLVDRANLYRIRENELFGRLVDFKARQGAFTVLSPEDQLLYLCLHTAKHGILNAVGLRSGYAAEWFCSLAAGNRLLWFLDIDLLLQQQIDQLDWTAIAERARRWNISDDLVNCLRVLRLLRPESPAELALQRLGHSSHETGAVPVRRRGTLDFILRSARGRALLERSMLNQSRSFRPVRFLLVGSWLTPSPSRLLRYYGRTSAAWIPWLYLRHPFHMLRKMLPP